MPDSRHVLGTNDWSSGPCCEFIHAESICAAEEEESCLPNLSCSPGEKEGKLISNSSEVKLLNPKF